MSAVVVDTDVISFLFKSDTRAAAYQPHLHGTLPLVSFMTLAELEQWALIRNWGALRRERLEAHLAKYTLVPFDRALCRAWAEVRVEARQVGHPIETSDAWIAATARLYRAPLITHNAEHFAGVTGLTVISEN